MRENLSEIMFCRRMAYDLSRPMVDNGQMKKCLPTLDFLLTRARAFEKPTIPPGIGPTLAALHWAVIGIIGSVLRKWFHCNIEPFCVHIGFSHPDTHLSSGLSCHSLDKVAVWDWSDRSKT